MESEKKLLKKESIPALLTKLQQSGKKVFVPTAVDDRVDFKAFDPAVKISLDHVQTTQSAKSAIFPKVEELFRFQTKDGQPQLQDRDLSKVPEVVAFGLRPCDAVSIAALRSIFTWDYQDALFKTRLEKLTVIGVSCSQADDFCFCTAVGLGPGDTRGSDILLTRLSGGDFLAEILSEKGRLVKAAAPDLFLPAPSEGKEANLAEVVQAFPLEKVKEKMDQAFDKEAVWVGQSLRCLGCGACAFVCPTCACFDIQDEGATRNGTRLRCWDSCGLSLFTLHTSGHNPREVQSQRWRQRLLHKFSYMPDRLQVLGCVGCGRCSRSCPVDMNIKEHVCAIVEAKA